MTKRGLFKKYFWSGQIPNRLTAQQMINLTLLLHLDNPKIQICPFGKSGNGNSCPSKKYPWVGKPFCGRIEQKPFLNLRLHTHCFIKVIQSQPHPFSLQVLKPHASMQKLLFLKPPNSNHRDRLKENMFTVIINKATYGTVQGIR